MELLVVVHTDRQDRIDLVGAKAARAAYDDCSPPHSRQAFARCNASAWPAGSGTRVRVLRTQHQFGNVIGEPGGSRDKNQPQNPPHRIPEHQDPPCELPVFATATSGINMNRAGVRRFRWSRTLSPTE